MSKPGAKKNDQIVSVTPGDVHIIMIPSPGGPVPTPIPHPCASTIKDKVAKKVKVMGQPGAVKGSKSKHTPPHIPQGGPFQKPPGNKGEVVTGSSSVKYEGKDATMLGETGKMCADPSDAPVGKVIGTAAMVLIGGGSASGNADRAKASADSMKAASAQCHQWIDQNLPPGAEREKAHRDLCTATGHPVDVATGKMFTRNVDVELTGRVPVSFVRNYSSARSREDGDFGYGWRHSYQVELWVHEDFVMHRDQNGRCLGFEPIEVGQRTRSSIAGFVLEKEAAGYRAIDVKEARRLFEPTERVKDGARLHRLSAIEDRYGNRVCLEYDDQGRLCRIHDAAGRRLIFLRNDQGRVRELALIRAEGGDLRPLRRFEYSEGGDLVRWEDELGQAYRFEYSHHLLVKETNRCGLSFFFRYDEQEWCRETWGDGGLLYRRLDYDRLRQKTRVIDSEGFTSSYSWNDDGLVEEETDHLGHATQFVFDDAQRVVRVEDPVGNVWSTEYDESGRVVATENPEGASTQTEWDPDGRWMVHQDAKGSLWRRDFDESGREVRSTNPNGGTRVVLRDAQGDVVWIRHESGEETRCTYNAQGERVEIILPTDLEVRREYSWRGDLIREYDQLGERLRVEYDARGNRSLVWERNRGRTRFEYDPEGRICRITDPKGRVTDYEYGHFDKIVRIQDPEVRGADGRMRRPVRRYEYDRENRLVASVEPGGEATRYHYDGRKRPMRIDYPDGRCQAYVRDGRDFVVALHENDEKVFEQTLDSAGRVLRRVSGDGQVLTFEYDADGNAINGEVDGAGAVRLEYDALGRLVGEGGEHGARDIAYGSSPDQISYRWNDELSLECQWVRTPAGIGWQVFRQGGLDLELDYDERERLTRAAFASGEKQAYAYGDLDKPLQRRVSNAGGSESVERFTYDPEGWLSGFDDVSVKEQYERDGLNRLIRLRREGEGSVRDDSWGFDEHGNRVVATGLNGTKVESRYLPGNRIMARGSETYAYDSRGRVREITGPEGRFELVWDALGRLTAVTLPSGQSVSMRYDAFGRRIEKSGPGGTFHYGWFGNRLIHERRPDGEERHYLYQGDTHRPVACYLKDSSGGWRLYAFLTDLRGAPTRVTDDEQRVVWRQDPGPWGEREDGSWQFDQPISLPGQYRDAETGLHYNFARFYLPRAGCYLSPDPIGPDGGPNAYAYVPDPICWSDPLGLSGDDHCGGSGGSETFYRTMSKQDFETLQRTGRMPGTSETFISPTQAFSEDYAGVTVEFKMEPGTTNKLEDFGVRDSSRLTIAAHPDMPPVKKGWKSDHAYFKGEDDQINVGLGSGKALDTFNDNIQSFEPVSER